MLTHMAINATTVNAQSNAMDGTPKTVGTRVAPLKRGNG